ncbi:type II toxin-antitoxin system VapC family toxin [Methylocystis heyeri]|uniref:Ribonuclease VapC n=1 Tax=Methylocystis heyeri TaxID=391905 RepID=A0A6B8KJQ1_9HYPH|nr:type II toxin-antitoxin system VapC family toxin [Methylocystis heyeri]QGM47867.1 PIN domain-containing protein [Methylocystis heyeri]
MNDAVILLDTNIVSELMRPNPSRAVLDWFAARDSTRLFLSAVSEAELRLGAAILPAGKRRDGLTAAIDIMIAEDFAGRLLPFDSAAAKAYAVIAAKRRAAGQPIMEADCQIAAIARVRGAAVATRNVRDLEGCGVEIVDPFNVS